MHIKLIQTLIILSAEYKLLLLIDESNFDLHSSGMQSQAHNCSISLKKYRVIQNDFWGFNNLSYTTHLR